jgi:hypothetical protein
MKQFTEQIGMLLAQRLPGFTFKKRESGLIRPTDKGWQAIAIDVLSTASRGVGKLAADARIRIDELERLYTQHHPFLRPQDAKGHATLTMNCDNLLKNKALTHGFNLDGPTIHSFAEVYAQALQADVIPWLEKYSDEQSLYEGLANADPFKWITSDRLTRFPVLMAILAKRGDVKAFDSVASEFEDWCKQKHAIVYVPLAAAMLKLRPTSESAG